MNGSDSMDSYFAGPQKIDDFEVLKAIGRGKFSTVFWAKRKHDNKVVALKRISTAIMDEKSRQKTMKEVELLKLIRHKNIVRTYDAFVDEGFLVIALEWAEAGDLKRQIRKVSEKKGKFEERIIWRYFSQICDAIQHMHDRRVMHRDLKPANIFLMINGTVKVGDFGLSRMLSEATLQAHSKVGTPLYMSPEVLGGHGYGFKCDIWSLGCILYELAVLRSPFKADGLSLYDLFRNITKGEYSLIQGDYSSELCDLCYRMLKQDPDQRPNITEVASLARERRLYSRKNRNTSSVNFTQTAKKSPKSNNDAQLGVNVDIHPSPVDTLPNTQLWDSEIEIASEEVADKLSLLGYNPLNDGSRCQRICRLYFAYGHVGFSTDKFCWLTVLCKALLRELRVELVVPKSRSSLSTAQAMVYSVREWVVVKDPTLLISGYGLEVCLMLKPLVDMLLKSRFSFSQPSHDFASDTLSVDLPACDNPQSMDMDPSLTTDESVANGNQLQENIYLQDVVHSQACLGSSAETSSFVGLASKCLLPNVEITECWQKRVAMISITSIRFHSAADDRALQFLLAYLMETKKAMTKISLLEDRVSVWYRTLLGELAQVKAQLKALMDLKRIQKASITALRDIENCNEKQMQMTQHEYTWRMRSIHPDEGATRIRNMYQVLHKVRKDSLTLDTRVRFLSSIKMRTQLSAVEV